MPIRRTSTSEFIANTKSNIFNEQNSDDEYDEIDYYEGASLPSSSSSFDIDDDIDIDIDDDVVDDVDKNIYYNLCLYYDIRYINL